MMVIGERVGKTTTIGKLAARLAQEGKKVVLAAGDTFARPPSSSSIWGERSGAVVVRSPEGADPSSVITTPSRRRARSAPNACICDTAGRLHTKVNLMEEPKATSRHVNKARAGPARSDDGSRCDDRQTQSRRRGSSKKRSKSTHRPHKTRWDHERWRGRRHLRRTPAFQCDTAASVKGRGYAI